MNTLNEPVRIALIEHLAIWEPQLKEVESSIFVMCKERDALRKNIEAAEVLLKDMTPSNHTEEPRG